MDLGKIVVKLRKAIEPALLDGLVTSVAPLPADEVGHKDDEDQAGQGSPHDDGDQHVIHVQLALLSCNRKTLGLGSGSVPGQRRERSCTIGIHFIFQNLCFPKSKSTLLSVRTTYKTIEELTYL